MTERTDTRPDIRADTRPEDRREAQAPRDLRAPHQGADRSAHRAHQWLYEDLLS